MGFEQLLKNKQGGLLEEMLKFIEKTVPGGKKIISPLVRKQVAPLLKNQFIPWLKNLIDNELDTVIDGAGLKRRMNRKLDSLLKPITPVSLGQIEQIAEYLDLYKFRGVFMRQLLPDEAHEIECGILNLGDL